MQGEGHASPADAMSLKGVRVGGRAPGRRGGIPPAVTSPRHAPTGGRHISLPVFPPHTHAHTCLPRHAPPLPQLSPSALQRHVFLQALSPAAIDRMLPVLQAGQAYVRQGRDDTQHKAVCPPFVRVGFWSNFLLAVE